MQLSTIFIFISLFVRFFTASRTCSKMSQHNLNSSFVVLQGGKISFNCSVFKNISSHTFLSLLTYHTIFILCDDLVRSQKLREIWHECSNHNDDSMVFITNCEWVVENVEFSGLVLEWSHPSIWHLQTTECLDLKFPELDWNMFHIIFGWQPSWQRTV